MQRSMPDKIGTAAALIGQALYGTGADSSITGTLAVVPYWTTRLRKVLVSSELICAYSRYQIDLIGVLTHNRPNSRLVVRESIEWQESSFSFHV
jgi:hypothetical protein